MDSVTQIALGAAVGYATITPRHGVRHGVKAAIWGGVCGTVPDLDTFYPFDTDVDSFTWHRGYSHSVFVLGALSPLIATALTRLHPLQPAGQSGPQLESLWQHWRDWWLMVFLCLLTHPLLDCFTVYGTQVLLPLSDQPVSWSTIFIIDPLYTLPLIVGLGIALGAKKPHWNTVGLVLSSAYLAFGVLAKDRVESAVDTHLAEAGIVNASVLTTPTPFNGVVWRILIRDGDRTLEGFDSILDGTSALTFVEQSTGDSLLGELASTADVQRLQWFSHGHYIVQRHASTLRLCDQRMGLLNSLVFCFTVGDYQDDRLQAVEPAQFVRAGQTLPMIGQLMRWIGQRIRNPLPSSSLSLTPE